MKRASIVLISLAVAALGVGAWFLFWPRVSLPPDLLAAVPGDAYGLVRVRVDRVIASDAYERLIVERGEARGVERVKTTCGFNPLEQVRELVVFARPAPTGGYPRFAFAARGELRHEALIDCVKKFTTGSASTLRREDIEGIPTVQSSQGSSRAAFFGRDGIIGGDAESVRAAIHAVLQQAPSAAADPVLAGLFHEIEQGTDVTLVTRLPEGMKPLIRQLGAVAGPSFQQLEQLRALGASLTTSSGRLAGGAQLIMADPRHASALVELGQQSVSRLLGIPGIGLTPAAGVLRGVQMEARGERATFAGSVKVSTIEALLELLPALERFGLDLAGAAGSPPSAAPAPSPSPASPATPATPAAVSEGDAGVGGDAPEPKRRRRRETDAAD